MHDSTALENVGQKSAQAGYSEAVLNRTLYMIDVERKDCLYVLPSQTPDASVFSAARFDPALELSEYLSGLFSDVKNVGHKRAGTCNLYVRGSNSRSGLKSVPVSFLVLDEMDEMTEENIPLAIERLSGQFEKQIWKISTPTAPNFGINKAFLGTTQEHYFFPCPRCSRHIDLNPSNLKVTGEELDDPGLKDSYIFCHECKGTLHQQEKIEFLNDPSAGFQVTAANPDPEYRGFYVNQLYSQTITPYELAKAVIRAQYDPASEQELFNSKWGLPHVVDGHEITMGHFADLIKSHKRTDVFPGGGFITMGVDPGKRLHYEIDYWYLPNGREIGKDLNASARCKVLDMGHKLHFNELEDLIKNFQIAMTVIDAQPENRKAFELSNKFKGRVKLCTYLDSDTQRTIQLAPNQADWKINANRTSWIDMALGRFFGKTIDLPSDTPLEYKNHLCNIKRVYQKDRHGNPIGRYVQSGPDHFAHARTYAEIALPIAASIRHGRDITCYL